MGCDIHGIFQAKTVRGWHDIKSDYKENRHYLLFGWLGNVRNGHGVAGSKLNSGVTPLSDRRGFPEGFDVDGEEHVVATIDFMTEWDIAEYKDGDPMLLWMGDHSYSWVTGNEVLKSKLPKMIGYGVVSIENYKKWDGTTKPSDYSLGVIGMGIQTDDPDFISEKTTHVNVQWEFDPNESIKYFTDEVRKLTDKYKEVRYVFGFDS